MSGTSSEAEVALFDDEDDSGSETEYEAESESDSVNITDTGDESDEIDDHDDSGSTVLLLSSNEIEISSGSETDFEELTVDDEDAESMPRLERGQDIGRLNNNHAGGVGGQSSQSVVNNTSVPSVPSVRLSTSGPGTWQSVLIDSTADTRTRQSNTGSNVNNEGAGPSRSTFHAVGPRTSQRPSSTGAAPAASSSQPFNPIEWLASPMRIIPNLEVPTEQIVSTSSSHESANQLVTRPNESVTAQTAVVQIDDAETIYVQQEEVELMQVEVLTANDPPPSRNDATEESSRNDSLREFKTPKKPATTTATKEDGSSDDDAETCIICYEPWTNSGVHRLTSLKCGHLFGQSCIEKWLRGQGGKCPQCNAKAKKSDIRVIYAKALRTIDTTDRDRALKELEREKEVRRKMELETAQLNLKYQMAMEEVNRMKTQLKAQQGMARNHASFAFSSSQPSTSSASSSSSQHGSTVGKRVSQGQYILDKSIMISQNGGCRVMAFDGANYSLVVSMPSSNQLFPGFGIKKVSAMDVRNTQYVPIHSKMIRDIDFNGRHDGLMLTASVDKTVKITSLTGNTVVQSYNTEMPAWCCAWNTEDMNYIYAGLQNGTVRIYDTRQTSTEVETLNKEGPRCPIVSLNYVPAAPGKSFWSSGVLTGTLEGTTFWEKIGAAEYRPQKQLDGNCTCLNFDPVTRHCMASFRPNKSHPATRHVSSLDGMVEACFQHSFFGCFDSIGAPRLVEVLCADTDPGCSLLFMKESVNFKHVQMCELKSIRAGATTDALVTSNAVQTMYGGTTMKLLTKSVLYEGPTREGQLLVAAGDEASCSAIVWDASTGNQAQKLAVNTTVLDVCPFAFNRNNYLACLTEKHVKLYRWQQAR